MPLSVRLLLRSSNDISEKCKMYLQSKSFTFTVVSSTRQLIKAPFSSLLKQTIRIICLKYFLITLTDCTIVA